LREILEKFSKPQRILKKLERILGEFSEDFLRIQGSVTHAQGPVYA